MESLNQNINLIPESEIVEQQKKQAIKFSSVFSVLLFAVIFIASVYFFITSTDLKNSIDKTDIEITRLRSEVVALENVEIIARNLDKKYKVLTDLFKERPNYSLLLKEFRHRTPEGLSIKSMDIREGSASISGTAENYVSISSFINNLLNKDFNGGIGGLQELFTSVSLNSVNLEGSVNTVRFYIVVGFDESILR